MKRRNFFGWAAATFGGLVGMSGRAGATTTGVNETRTPLESRLTVAPVWPRLAKVSSVPVGQSVTFTYGAGSKFPGKQGALHRVSSTSWKAFDLICTHHGCTAIPQGAVAVCPCHHSEFSLTTGAALVGPAQLPLTGANVTVKSDGYVYWVSDL
jgi:Rieske Fe-S protein